MPDSIYKPAVSAALLIAALLLFRRIVVKSSIAKRETAPPMPLAALIGGLIGLLSSLTATGGGVFLGLLLILFGWVTPGQAAGLSSAFILLNSVAG